MLYSLLRPLLFRLDPERAHDLTLAWLAHLGRLQGFNPLGQPHTGSPKEVMGLSVPNPVGLAAGTEHVLMAYPRSDLDLLKLAR